MSTLFARRELDRPRERVPAGGAVAGHFSLVGTWVNYDVKTRGLLRLLIKSAEDGPEGLDVHVFAAGDSAVLDWGVTRCQAFAGSVDGGDAVGFCARFRHGSIATLLAAYLDLRLLAVDTYTSFEDGSGRTGYLLRDHFYRIDP